MTGRAANDLLAVRRPRRMMTTSHYQSHVLAACFHHVNAGRLARRSERDSFAIRRKHRFDLVGDSVWGQRSRVLAANSLHKQIEVSVVVARIDETLTVGRETGKKLRPMFVGELHVCGARPVDR